MHVSHTRMFPVSKNCYSLEKKQQGSWDRKTNMLLSGKSRSCPLLDDLGHMGNFREVLDFHLCSTLSGYASLSHPHR